MHPRTIWFFFWAAALALFQSTPVNALCDPTRMCCATTPGSGNPCASGDSPATLFGTKPVDTGAGNPIDIISGNKFQREVDLPTLPGILGLEIVRTYNSELSTPKSRLGLLGRGWRLSYETRLIINAHAVSVDQADGKRLTFNISSAIPDRFESRLEWGWIERRATVQTASDTDEYLWYWPNGRQLRFNHLGQLTQIEAPSGETVRLEYDQQQLTRVIDPQGRQLRLLYPIDRAGKSIRLIQTPVGEFEYVYTAGDAGQLAKVNYPRQGDRSSLANTLAPTPLKQLERPQLNTWMAPTQDMALLAKGLRINADTPRRISRVYHYEDARFRTLLTGISVQTLLDSDAAAAAGMNGVAQAARLQAQRISTYGYDSQGRANLSARGEVALPDEIRTSDAAEWVTQSSAKRGKTEEWQAKQPSVTASTAAPVATLPVAAVANAIVPEQVHLEWPEPGKVILTNSLRQKTVYKIATIDSQPRITEVRGPGCASCGPSNVRYRYDDHGRLLEQVQLDIEGSPIEGIQTRYDSANRVLDVSRVRYFNSQPQPPRLEVRYGYATVTQTEPDTLSRPSVVPGQMHTIHIEYNAARQPIKVTETGFSPLNDQGESIPTGVPLRRVRIYQYQVINGVSHLVQADGPLPNGPKADPTDSDITRFEWDAKGSYLQAVITPLNQRVGFKFDAAGQITETTGLNGVSSRYERDFRGEVLTASHWLGNAQLDNTSYRRDALGRITEITERGDGNEKPRLLQGFDNAGRLQWQADALGILRQADYDPEGHLLRSAVLGAHIQQEERYTYDDQGRLQRIQDNTGATRELVRDAAGRIIASLDPLGRATRYEAEPNALRVTQAVNTRKPLSVRYQLDANGQLQAIRAEASDGRYTSSTQVHQRVVDDFGREVAVISPDSGREVRRFDADGHLVEAVEADGNQAEFEYDVAGRLVRRTVIPGGIPAQMAKPQTVRYRYAGVRLMEIEDAEQTERYSYDQLGRASTRTVILRLNNGQDVSSVTEYRYDSQGQLAAQTLPDGSELQYQRNGQGQIIALHRQSGPWAPFGWGRTPLAKDIERDLIGLSRLTYGNDIQGQWQRSREGVLGRVVYITPHGAPPSFPSLMHIALAHLIPEAKAQTAAVATSSSAPGAFGLPTEANTLWDSRLLFDVAGNLTVQSQFADSAIAKPTHTLLAYDAQDQLAQAVRSPSGKMNVGGTSAIGGTAWRYHHDSVGNRLLSQQSRPAEDRVQSVKAVYASSSDREAERVFDAAGRPLKDGRRGYQWDGLGRLQRITQDDQAISYRYNRLGLRVAKQVSIGRDQREQHYLYDEQRHRIAELDAQGRLTRQYVWVGEQLLAVLDPAQPVQLRAPANGVFAQLGQTLHALWLSMTDPAPRIAYVHVNHLGAPIAMTDAQARPIWRADYAPFGQRFDDTGVVKTGAMPLPSAKTLRLDLRLPGQWEDEESGLYYNDQRYYDPETGRYLSPDPLGMQGGLNAYAYVGNNPLGYGDPLGLILFAFDGTGNTDDEKYLDKYATSPSNVWQFRQLYQDGDRRYISGVGMLQKDSKYGDIDPADYKPGISLLSAKISDFKNNWSGPDRIARMVQYFNDEADLATDDKAAMDVDIVGFSRGAAEARDFANYIVAHTQNGVYSYTGTDNQQHCQKVNFRFMGLYDTVLSNNQSGYSYNLAIPAEFSYVAQAVALNEYRGDNTHAGLLTFGAFPLESIMQGPSGATPQPGETRIERGFLGSHADIGGGFGTDDSQLSQVALVWMIDQAKAAGVNMNDPAKLHTIISNPVIHDKSDSLETGAPTATAEDREVRYSGGSKTTQRDMVFDAGMSYADTQQFINYFGTNDPRRRFGPYQTGTVDMQGYLEWLNNNGYNLH